MKLVNFLAGESIHLGAVVNGRVFDLADVGRLLSKAFPASVEEAVAGWEWEEREIHNALDQVRAGGSVLQETARKTEEVRFAPPDRTPNKILCVFVNYHSHGQDVKAPSEPIFFFKHQDSIVGDWSDVWVPRFSSKADHEVELGVIIGKKGRDIAAEDAYGHVAGYTVLNDISFRDGMRRGIEGTVLGRNLFKGKVADTALPMGPALVTRDEIPDPYPLKLSLRVNGDIRQDGSTDDMIFRIPDLIASASEGITLLPGDVIATGTCSGVGLYTGKYLNDGDLMEAEVEGVGVLRNRVRFQTTP
jgi:2-keto-4-pentenoate hydratase/2-oxohepta-3-ene-1,7-dioic acid hydratase in catechol pathway